MSAARTAAVVVGAMLLAGTVGTSAGESPALVIRARTNAEPSVAADAATVVVTWAAATEAGETDIYAAVSRDGGRMFGAPTRVNDMAGDARVSGEQPPHVALVPRAAGRPAIVVVWTAKAAAGTRLLTARSDDGGRTFGRATPVPGTEAAGNRGWESTATDHTGHVLALWLDHRELVAPAGQAMPMPMHHDAAPAGPATSETDVAKAEMSKLYFGSADGSLPARALTGGVCYCCKTTLGVGAGGAIYAAWRHVYPGDIRDIAFTLSRDGGRTFAPPVRVSDDRWVLNGCPENGPSLAADARGRVHIVWPTVVPDAAGGKASTLALFYAVSSDGRQFSPRQRLTTVETPRHPQVAVDELGRPVVTWDEQASGMRRVVAGRWQADGPSGGHFTREVLSGTVPSFYPAIATASGATILAWAESSPAGSAIRVTRLPN